jgi:hypothetical protein
MSTRTIECGSPAKVFRPILVAPQTESASIVQFIPDEEFAAGVANAAALAESIASARHAYNRQVELQPTT